MARIRNTGVPNIFGNGYEQELKLDNGKTYRIKNSGVPNIFGDGYEKEIEEINTTLSNDQCKNEPFTLKDILLLVFIGLPVVLFGLALVLGPIIGVITMISRM